MPKSLALLLLLGFLLACARAKQDSAFDKEKFQSYVENFRREYDLPGVVVSVTDTNEKSSGKPITAVAGKTVQPNSQNRLLSKDDLLPIASFSKSLTDVLILRRIEAGIMQLDSTLDDLLPKISMRDEYKKVTLSMLMTNLGGMPSETPLSQLGYTGRSRTELLNLLLNRPPDQPIGSQIYSTYGFISLGTILEIYSGEKWEELAAEEIFKPLGMSSCKFQSYPEDRALTIQSPIAWLKQTDFATILWGNDEDADEIWVPLDPTKDDTYYDPLWNPGAGIFCSIEDWQKFARFEAQGYKNRPTSTVLATNATYGEIFFAPKASLGDYAQGAWSLFDFDRSTKSFSSAWIYGANGGTVIESVWDPNKNFIITAFSNAWAWDGTNPWLDQLVSELSDRIQPKFFQ